MFKLSITGQTIAIALTPASPTGTADVMADGDDVAVQVLPCLQVIGADGKVEAQAIMDKDELRQLNRLIVAIGSAMTAIETELGRTYNEQRKR